MRRDDPFARALDGLGPALLAALAALERTRRQMHPPDFPSLRAALVPIEAKLLEGLAAFREAPPPADLGEFQQRLVAAATTTLEALDLFAAPAPPQEVVPRVLRAMQQHGRAQELLFALRRTLPPVNRFFLEPAVHGRLDELDPDPPPDARVGLHDAHNDLGERGGFSFYVPESYDGSRPWPLVVALHGGSGHGREFLWTWLREARSRRFLLLAPTARGGTWSFGAPDVDARALHSMVAWVSERWRIDSERVLLTGLSDGATYTLVCGLQPESPFTALAPVSGVLHPLNFANGNMQRAHGRRIYLVHGELDWMFPVGIARAAAAEIEKAGAQLTVRVLDDLSHTYPREENGRILAWFDTELALPSPQESSCPT